MKRAIVDSDTMNRLIAATKDFVAPEDYPMEMYKYIQLRFDAERKEVTAVGCDRYRLSVEKGPAFEVGEDFTAYIRPEDYGRPTRQSKTRFRFPTKCLVVISIEDDEAVISCNGEVTRCEKKKGLYPDYEKLYKDLHRKISLRVCVNPQYLLDAIKSVKESIWNRGSQNVYTAPVFLEFTKPDGPAFVIKDGAKGFRMVLPIHVEEGKI